MTLLFLPAPYQVEMKVKNLLPPALFDVEKQFVAAFVHPFSG